MAHPGPQTHLHGKKSQPKTILITGSTDGIGLATAKGLATAGHHVILHGRSSERLAKASEAVRASTSSPVEIQTWNADFSHPGSLKIECTQFADQLRTLDVVIHNAGVYDNDRVPTEWGLERTMTVNHFAPFILTHALLPLLKASHDGRVVTVSSIAHTRGEIDLRDLGYTRAYDPYKAYATSKLANILFAYELADRFSGSSLKSNVLHPGVITTKLLAAGFNTTGASVERGAETSIHLAAAESLSETTGHYFADKLSIRSSTSTYNLELRKSFWSLSEQITGLRF